MAPTAGDVPADPNAIASGTAEAAPAAQTITVKTDVLELQFSSQGAQLITSKLLNHPAAENPELPVQLFEQTANRTYVGQAGLVGVPDAPNHRTLFELVSGSTEFAPGQDQLKLVFKATSGGVENTTTYTIFKNRYDIDLVINARNTSTEPVSPSAYVQITRDGNPLESDSSLYATFTGPAVYTPEKKYQKIDFEDIADRSADYVKTADSGWLAMIQHYFVSAIIGQDGPRDGQSREGRSDRSRLQAACGDDRRVHVHATHEQQKHGDTLLAEPSFGPAGDDCGGGDECDEAECGEQGDGVAGRFRFATGGRPSIQDEANQKGYREWRRDHDRERD